MLDDDIVEEEECFVLSISLPLESANLAVSIVDAQKSVLYCIEDNDRESCL